MTDNIWPLVIAHYDRYEVAQIVEVTEGGDKFLAIVACGVGRPSAGPLPLDTKATDRFCVEWLRRRGVDVDMLVDNYDHVDGLTPASDALLSILSNAEEQP